MVLWGEAIGKRNIIGSRSTMDDEWNFNEADYWVKTSLRNMRRKYGRYIFQVKSFIPLDIVLDND